ncbi:ankyrin repeat-containing domain protein [Xylariales sp. PMI_506]|nr:ankyrin repeat-containing domain protein [Xylariales sp. PMI_506]
MDCVRGTHRLNAQDWARHEQTIRQLYVKEDMSLHDLIELMAERHNHYATKSQYETQFKRWKISKYRKDSDWQKISTLVLRRRQQGKVSVVYHNGVEIDPGTLECRTRKHKSRNHSSDIDVGSLRGFCVRTPPLSDDNMVEQNHDLPFFKFASFVLDQPHSRGNISLLTSHEASIPPGTHALGSHQIPITQQTGLTVYGEDHVSSFNSSSFLGVFDGIAPRMDGLELENVFAKYEKDIEPLVRAIFPESWILPNPHQQGRVITTRVIDWMSSSYVRLLIFGISNNFAGLDGLSPAVVWEYLRQRPDGQLSQFFKAFPGPTSQALSEKLLECALVDHDARGVGMILSAGFNINIAKIRIKDFRKSHTALEYACAALDLETAKVLLGYDPSLKAMQPSIHPDLAERDYDPITATLKSCSKDSDLRAANLVEFLVTAGAEITLESLNHAIRHGYTQVLNILMTQIQPNDVNTYFQEGVFHRSMRYLGLNTALKATKIVLQSLKNPEDLRTVEKALLPQEDQNRNDLGPLERSDISMPFLDSVAASGHIEVYRLLVENSCLMPSAETLARAIESENMELVQVILSTEIDLISPITSRLPTPFSAAIRSGCSRLVEQLISRGACTNIQSRDHYYHALAAAVEVGDDKWFRTLAEMDVEAHVTYLSACLHRAIVEGRDEMALYLIQAGAAVNREIYSRYGGEASASSYYVSPLETAIEKQNAFIVTTLLDAGAQNSIQDFNDVLEWGHLDIIQRMLAMGQNLNDADLWLTPLTVATNLNNYELVETLLNAGANINVGDPTPLSEAIEKGSTQMVKYLLAHGADPSTHEVLSSALQQPNEAAKLVLQSFAKLSTRFKVRSLERSLAMPPRPEYSRRTLPIVIDHIIQQIPWTDWPSSSTARNALLRVILEHHTQRSIERNVELLRHLLDQGYDPNGIVIRDFIQIWHTPCHKTAFLAAIETKCLNIVDIFVNYNANVRAECFMGVNRTPLQCAAEVGSLDIVQYLINHGADVNASASIHNGGTALQLAAIGGFLGIVDYLIRHRADINARGAKVDGRTALEGAAEHGRLDTVKLLLLSGANIEGDLGQQQFKRAVQLATKNGHMAVAEVLRSNVPGVTVELTEEVIEEATDDKGW